MAIPVYYPYRSESAKQVCLQYLDSLAARQWPVASEERVVPTRYGGTFVRISGPAEAPPLVLLHGAASTSLMWAPNIKPLSAEYRTFAVDQVGEFGRSFCTTPVRCLADLMTWLNELFDGLELRSGVNLMGISYGGALTAQYALRFPERLNRAVLLAPGMTVLRVTNEFILRTALTLLSSRRFLPPFLRWIFPVMTRNDPRWVNDIIEQSFLNFRNLQPRKIIVPPVLSDAEWRSLRVPVLFLVGEHERIYSPETAVQRLRRVAPQVRAEIVPGAGHDLTVAQADLVNQKILEYLKQERLAATTAGVP
jgi:pimeloyl-ACP methyl ester carboxylesterase